MDLTKPNRCHVLVSNALKALIVVASVLGMAVGAVAIDEFIAGSPSECDASALSRQLKEQGAYAAALWSGNLHGSGVCSIVIVARSLSPHQHESDEIEIYDPGGGHYVRVFAFRPGGTTSAGGGAAVPWYFRLDSPPTHEVSSTILFVGAFTQSRDISPGNAPVYPMAIQWLPARDRYTIAALVPERPAASKLALSSVHEEFRLGITQTFIPKKNLRLPAVSQTKYTPTTHLFSSLARKNFTAYTKPVIFRDALGGKAVRDYGVFQYAFTETEEESPALLVALATQYAATTKLKTVEGRVQGVEAGSGLGPIHGETITSVDPDQLELRAWTLSANPQVRLVGCQAYNGVYEGHSVYTVDVPRSQQYSISGRIWTRYLHSAECYGE